MTQVSMQLLWLPVYIRVHVMILLLILGAPYGQKPVYISALCTSIISSISDQGLLIVSHTSAKIKGDRTFFVYHWNSVPLSVISADSLSSIQSEQRTYLLKWLLLNMTCVFILSLLKDFVMFLLFLKGATYIKLLTDTRQPT